MSTLHLHFDESGDWNFNPKGSRYYIITAAWTYNPQPLADSLRALRFSLARGGTGLEGFHAAPDRQAVRDAVVNAIVAHDDWRFGSVVMEKRRINPSIRDPAKFYPTFAGALLRFVLRGSEQRKLSKLLIYADTLPMNSRAKKEGTLKAIHQTCAAELSTKGASHHAYSHCHQSNKWIQVADYCCWAIQKKWEKGDTRTYDQLIPRLANTELEITARSDGTTYY